ncbi:MAG: uracil phosphoribosyltransferase [Pseudomonadota bacterium]
MENVKVVSHPVIAHSLTVLRDINTEAAAFRRHADSVAHILLQHATFDLSLRETTVTTPLAETKGYDIADTVIAVPILRAGLAMLPAVQQLIPNVRVGFIGLERDEATAVAHQYYNKIPGDLAEQRVMVIDPMLATGGTMDDTIRAAKSKGADNIVIVCIVSSPEGVERITSNHSDVTIYTAALDEKLDHRKYIVPGLGDFGDRYFDTL